MQAVMNLIWQQTATNTCVEEEVSEYLINAQKLSDFWKSYMDVEIRNFLFNNSSPVVEGLWGQEDTEKFSMWNSANSIVVFIQRKMNIQVSKPVSALHMLQCLSFQCLQLNTTSLVRFSGNRDCDFLKKSLWQLYHSCNALKWNVKDWCAW